MSSEADHVDSSKRRGLTNGHVGDILFIFYFFDRYLRKEFICSLKLKCMEFKMTNSSACDKAVFLNQ